MTALVGNRGRERDDRRGADERRDEAGGRLLGKVLGDLERDREVVAPVELQRGGEVGLAERLGRDLELVAIDPLAVHAGDLGDPEVERRAHPAAPAAPDVDEAPGRSSSSSRGSTASAERRAPARMTVKNVSS